MIFSDFPNDLKHDRKLIIIWTIVGLLDSSERQVEGLKRTKAREYFYVRKKFLINTV